MTLGEQLPKPCRFEDLTRADQLGHIQIIGLICDGILEEAEMNLLQWSEIAPNCSFVLFVQPMFYELINAPQGGVKNVKQYHRIISYKDIQKAPSSREINVWATLSAYDGFGVLVKAELEAVVAEILEMNSGIFLAHNTEHQIVRCFDHAALNDRLKNRPYRILVYRAVCWCIKAFAWCSVHFGNKKYSWKRIN